MRLLCLMFGDLSFITALIIGLILLEEVRVLLQLRKADIPLSAEKMFSLNVFLI